MCLKAHHDWQAELYPTIVVGVFIDEPSTEFLRKLTGQSYPKHRMHLVIADLVSFDTFYFTLVQKELGSYWILLDLLGFTSFLAERIGERIIPSLALFTASDEF